MTTDDRLKALFNETHIDAGPEQADEFAFHFRDCHDDLLRIAEFLKGPSERFSQAQAKAAVDGILIHAVGHLVQAARMYHGLMDPFGKPPENDDV